MVAYVTDYTEKYEQIISYETSCSMLWNTNKEETNSVYFKWQSLKDMIFEIKEKKKEQLFHLQSAKNNLLPIMYETIFVETSLWYVSSLLQNRACGINMIHSDYEIHYILK